MGQATLSGSLTLGPRVATGSSSFGGTNASVPLGLLVEPKDFNSALPVLPITIDSPDAYVELGGIAAAGPVKRCNTLYVRSQSAVSLRITFDDGEGDTFESVIPLQGTLLLEAPDAMAILGVEVQGETLLEYCAFGPT